MFSRNHVIPFIHIYFLLLTIFSYSYAGTHYLSNEELFTRMRNANKKYPSLTHIYSIGKSMKGTDLLVLAISDTEPDKHLLLRPETKYIGNIHGNEVIGREILIRLIDYLLSNYGLDPQVTLLLSSCRIHIMPTMNPDGYDNSAIGDCEGVEGRYNSAGVDLNRDFPDAFDPDHRQREEVQPETAAIIRWIESQQFVLSANFHGGSMVVNYPFDSLTLDRLEDQFDLLTQPMLSEDDDTFQHIAKAYSYKNTNLRFAQCPRFKDGITNGAAWYPSMGGMQDYNYVFAGCMEVTVELSCCKYPNSSLIQTYWDDNVGSLIAYLGQVQMGVKGVVTMNDGTPAPGVTMKVGNRMEVKTTPNGEYWKLLLPGNYTLSVHYENFTLTSIPITAQHGEASVYNITLPFNYSIFTQLSKTTDINYINTSGFILPSLCLLAMNSAVVFSFMQLMYI